MITINDMKHCKLYNKQFYAPYNEKDKKKGSLIFLLTKSQESSLKLMTNKFMKNRTYHSYYIEKDITYFINNEGYVIDCSDLPYNVLTESSKDILNDTSRYVHAINLENFDCTNTNKDSIIQESLEDDFFNIEKPIIIYKYPKYVSEEEKKRIKNMVINKAEFYFRKASRSWSRSDLTLKYPYKARANVNDFFFAREYFNPMSSKCVLPRNYDNRNDKFACIGIKDGGKVYTVLLMFDKYNIKKMWLVFNRELVPLDPFIHECVKINEGNLEQEIEENKERESFEQGDLIRFGYTVEGYEINKYYIKDNQSMLIFEDALEMIEEASKDDMMLRKLLYRERFKNNKQMFALYDEIKEKNEFIKYTYIDLKRYKALNLFVDLYPYNLSFFKNNYYKLDKAVDLYFEFLNRLINKDQRFIDAGYNTKTIFLNVDEWVGEKKDSIFKFQESINPISVMIRLLRTDMMKLQDTFKGLTFVLFSESCYFKINIDELEDNSYILIENLIRRMQDKSFVPEDDETKDSKNAIVNDIIDKLEDNKNIKVYNLTGDSGDINKDELVKKIEKAASTSNSTDDAIDKLETDDKIKDIINQLQLNDDMKPDMTSARKARIAKLQSDFMEKKINNKSVRELIEESDKVEELPVTELKLDTINDEWKNLQFMNFDKSYDLRADILKIINSFSEKDYPVSVVDIDVKDASTTEDYIETITCKMEDSVGNRFTLKFDVPKLKDDKFMILRGNEKTISGQLVLLPISKTDDDTCQIVSFYNKIFVRTYGTSVVGRSCASADILYKALSKYPKAKFTNSDNTAICNKYDLPIDYTDLASAVGIIETDSYIFYFNQDEIREKYKIDDKLGLPFGYSKKNKKVLYHTSGDETITKEILSLLGDDDNEFFELSKSLKLSSRYKYSKASILNTEIPIVVVMGYSVGLIAAMDKAHIEYELVEKRPKADLYQDFIKFKDGYIVYNNKSLASSLFMNGLKECNTEDYSLNEINTKAMFLDFLNIFGGRILSDGLDNFYDLAIDPITKEVLHDYKLPDNYIELLAYANDLLVDNKYIEHTDLSSNRYRSNEIIAGYVYKALADSYGRYRNILKRTNKAAMSIKQSQVIDNIMLDPTASDASILNPLLEIETMNSVTFKGLSGMNSDRSYSLDKRTFGDSMINVLALSTGFAGNVGVTRQATIDMNVQGKRGYIKQTKNMDNLNTTKTFCMTEAILPYATTHDDPFRMAMGFIQNSKHAMKTNISSPQLISNGADQALPYMITNNFAFKAKKKGKIIQKTDNFCILQYYDGTKDFIDLRDNVKKNSNAGFYTSIKLDTDYKVGKTFKEGEIIAYDKGFFSNTIGDSDNLAYNAGILCKVAIMNTDEGFEDSAIVTEWLSEAMASKVIVTKEVNLDKNTNILEMVKKGQSIQEGDNLILFQNSYDDADVNMLLKTISDDIDEVTDLGKIPLKSKITGTVKDIKVYRTVEVNELSDSLKKIVNGIEKESASMEKEAKKNGIDYVYGLNPTYKLESTGKLKNVEEGVKIEFYLEYEDKFSVGDKLIYYSAVKGVDKDIIKSGDEPYTDRDPDEPIDSLVPLGGISARMVTSVENLVAANKVLIELDKVIKKKAGIRIKPFRDRFIKK